MAHATYALGMKANIPLGTTLALAGLAGGDRRGPCRRETRFPIVLDLNGAEGPSR